VVPISLSLVMIKGKYFDIERAIERRESIAESDIEDEMLLSQTGGTSEVYRKGAQRKDFGMSAVRF
jgi:hypothetical protein